MNSKGVLITLAIFVYLSALLAFNAVILQSELSSRPDRDILVLDTAGSVFTEIKRNVVFLDLNSTKKNSVEDGLPFQYELLDTNSLRISFRHPLSEVVWNDYFESLQAYGDFMERQIRESFPANMHLDINSVDSNSTDARFVIYPYCLQLRVVPTGGVFSGTDAVPCQNQFHPAVLRKLDVNIVIDDVFTDWDRLQCFNGELTSIECNSDFNLLDSRPFVQLNIDTARCPQCDFDNQTVALHLDPFSDLNVWIDCTRTGCTAQPLSFRFGNGFSFFNDSNQVLEAFFRMDFNEGVSAIRDLDINARLTVPEFGIILTTDPTELPNPS